MNEHPHDALPAFALGALDAAEASQVIGHVAACPACREDIETWTEVIALLPYAAAQYQPPSHVKRRLLAMVSAAGEAPAAHAGRRRAAAFTRLLGAATAGSLVLALVFGMLFANARRQAGDLNAQLDQRNEAMQQISTELGRSNLAVQRMSMQLDQARKGFDFIAYGASVDRMLEGQQRAEGKMFMRPGAKEALLVVHGLRQPDPGKTYQFWFAAGDEQVPATTFTVGPEGVATVVLTAPRPVNTYTQVRVTVEPAGGSKTPSTELVFQATLST
jgi:anti-sigma-K factor RskA